MTDLYEDLDITLATDEDLNDPIGLIAAAGYRWQTCQCLRYDRFRPDIFPQPYLANLYRRTGESGRSRMGSLPNLFCGMNDLSMDTICAYLHARQVIIVGEWRTPPPARPGEDPLPDNFEELVEPFFHALGYCFLTTEPTRSRDGSQASAFAGYGFFSDSWGRPQQTVLMYLGLSFLFNEYRLTSIKGIRYADNHLTARFASKFGFVDCGEISEYMTKWGTGELAPARLADLSRTEFERRLRGVLVDLRST